MKTTKTQLRASYNWRQNHKAKARHASYRSSAKTFVSKHATKPELKVLLNMICNKLGYSTTDVEQSNLNNKMYKNQHIIGNRQIAMENAINKLANKINDKE